jgi:glycosyltransferase involved in cell wall biosynthesis
VYHVCGDFGTLTGGALINREIARTLEARFAAKVVHPRFPRALHRFRHAPGSLLVTNVALAAMRVRRGSVVVIDHGHSRDTCLVVWLWKWLLGCRVVCTVGHLDFNAEQARVPRALLRAREHLWAASGDHVFTVSRSTAQQLARIRGTSQRIQIMPVTRNFGPRDPRPARPVDEEEVVLLFVGNVDQRKGIDQALRALAAFRGEHRITYRVVGSMPQNRYTMLLRQLAQAIRSGASVEFHGRVSRTELEGHLRAADAFLFPSHWEGYGIAIEEAMSFALPVIACRVGAVPELVIDGECGWLVDDRDEAAMTRAITECVEDGAERVRRGALAHARARQLSSRCDPGRVVGDLVAAELARATAGGPPPGGAA